MDAYFKYAQSQYGASVKLSVAGWSAIQAGQSIKPFSNFEWSAGFTPTREKGGRPDRFGGHMACKANSALDLTSTRNLNGMSVLQVFVNHASSSGRRDITAFSIPSPYSGERLLPGDDLSAIATTKKSNKAVSTKNFDREKQSTPPTPSNKIGFVDIIRDARGTLLASFCDENGEITSLSRDELIRKIALYRAKNLAPSQEETALRAIDGVSVLSVVPQKDTSDTSAQKKSAKVIPLKPRT